MISEALKIVEELNAEVYEYFERYGLSFPLFEIKSDGFIIVIDFMGNYRIWNSDEEERDYIDETDKYEPLELYLRRKAQKIID